MRTPLLACAGGVLAVALSVSASAGVPERQPTAARLTVSNVDFNDRASVETFYADLQRAAHTACDSRLADRAAREADAACMRAAADAAVARLSRPVLTAMHQTRAPTAYAVGY